MAEVITRCAHGHVCPVNAGRALHPMLLDVCEGGEMKADPNTWIKAGDDAVLDNHRMVRDGSFWRCANECGAELPFPAGLVVPDTLCVPRRWGDQSIVSGG